MTSHEVDYTILGDDMQLVEIELDPGETVVAEAGAMNYMESGITFEAVAGDGSAANQSFWEKLKSGAQRAMSGTSIFMTHYTNSGHSRQKVAFASPYPGRIIAANLAEHGQGLLVQKDAFLCAAKGTKISIAVQKKLGAGFFGGEGFILQKLEGDGMVFVHACGTIVRKDLAGETLRVDPGCIVAFAPSITFDVERAGNLKSMFFGGEGLYLATLSGHGSVWLQSLPFSRLADRIVALVPSQETSKKGFSFNFGGES
jgi:uncharacterized protein (TIGR00266 family)